MKDFERGDNMNESNNDLCATEPKTMNTNFTTYTFL